MHSPSPLQSVWLRAALLGSLWASIEIVLGSFLHNIRMPMAGTLMATIGIMLLVAGSRAWSMRGLIWRAGVICALMKSISPSAVVFGPMLGILLEAFALESALRLFGRNRAGYLLGGILAALMPLVQHVAGYLFIYGTDAARLYVALFAFAARSLGIQSLTAVDLLLLFASVNVALGALAAVAGVLIGHRALAVTSIRVRTAGIAPPYAPPQPIPAQRFSLLLLLVHGIFLVTALSVLGGLPLWGALLLTTGYVVAVALLYPAVRAKLRRPRLWIEFAVVALLSGLLLGELTSRLPGWTWSGLSIGLLMALRGTLMVTAFGAIGIELRNPRVVHWFLQRGMGQVAAALDVAFEALPAITVALGEERTFFRTPLQSLARLIAFARDWLDFIERAQAIRCRVFIVSGDRGSGKTTLLARTAELLLAHGKGPAGLLAPAVRAGDMREGYDLVDLSSGTTLPLCRRTFPDTGMSTGPFRFDPAAIRAGREALAAAASGTATIFLDEVGPLELDGDGWSPAIDALLPIYHGNLVLTVRPSLVERVIDRWHLHPSRIWEATSLSPDTLSDVLLLLQAAKEQHAETVRGGSGGSD